MSVVILKSGNTILKAGNTILTSGSGLPTPVLDVNPENISLPNGAEIPFIPSGFTQKFMPVHETARAYLIENVINGKPVIRTSVANTRYDSVLPINVRTVFVVVRYNTHVNWATIFAGINTPATNYGYFMGSSGETESWFNPSTPGLFAGANLNRLFVNGLEAKPKSNAVRQKYFTLLTLDIVEEVSPPININRIGGWGSLDYRPFEGYFWGDYARLIAYEKRLTEDQRIQVQNELMAYYNL